MVEGRIDLGQYYNSERWRALRNLTLNFYHHKCVKCGSSYELNVHHKHYKKLGNEDINDIVAGDLTVLCRRCHNDNHYFRGEMAKYKQEYEERVYGKSSM